MVYAIFTFIALGIAGGYFFLGLEHKDLLDEILMSALYFMVFVAGIEIGGNRHIIKKICNPQSILLAVAIPTAVISSESPKRRYCTKAVRPSTSVLNKFCSG